MRVLFVTPYPLSRVRIRSYGFASQLVKHHEVKVISLSSGKREEEDIRILQNEGFDITAIREKPVKKYVRALQAYGTQLPLQVAFDASPRLRAAIATLMKAEHFDLLHIEFVRALGALPDNLPVPIVWDAVDCISQLYEQGAHYGATTMLRLIGRGEAARTRAYEQARLRQFRQVLVTSERDRQALLALSQGRSHETIADSRAEITVIPHGIDQHYFQPYTGVRHAQTLVFSGKMSFHANRAGALLLAERILPRIWKCRPDVRLVIAGSDPPAEIRNLARDRRILVTGYVQDIRPYIAQAQIAVCPLPYAVGIQNKILEAMALGTPVIASSSAVGGLQTRAGHDLLVADEPEAVADLVIQLLDNRLLWGQLAQNGLNYIAAYHNWETILEQLVAVYTRTIEKYARTMNAAHYA